MKLLKFDTVLPTIFLFKKQEENREIIQRMNRDDYLKWIISLRSNYSDFYTYWLNTIGWDVEEFIVNDPFYIKKVSEEINSIYDRGLYFFKKKLAKKLLNDQKNYEKNIFKKYIEIFQPDVLLIREHTSIESEFWSQFRKNTLVTSRIASPFPPKWNPTHFDIIFTNVELYLKLAQFNGIASYYIPNGFDERLIGELTETSPKYDVSFVGGLGDRWWKQRTDLFEYLAGNCDLYWWGFVKEPSSPLSDNLMESFQGITSGIEMYQIYNDSRIVINDYPEIADGMAVNQRFMEALGVGTFMLTREARNLSDIFPSDIFITYKDKKDCLDKVNYYLKNNNEREEIAKRGQEYVLQNCSYRIIMQKMSSILLDHLQ